MIYNKLILVIKNEYSEHSFATNLLGIKRTNNTNKIYFNSQYIPCLRDPMIEFNSKYLNELYLKLKYLLFKKLFKNFKFRQCVNRLS
jgi:hypothetical protein